MAAQLVRVFASLLFVVICLLPGQPVAAQTGAAPTDFFAQDWRLNPRVSHIYMQSVKKNLLFETHKFGVLEGKISKDGAATIKIELASLATGIDVRDVRMRFLFFETFKFPYAEITATLDKAAMQGLLTQTRLSHTLKFKLNLHGVVKEMVVPVVVTRIVNNAVSVATVEPVIIKAADFALTPGIARLVEAAGGIMITPAASISFDLVFEGANYKPELAAARVAAAKQRVQQSTARMSADACKTRLDVISKTRAIYFATASAELDQESGPLLNSVAQITRRCPSVRVEISGHTDSDGSANFNQKLSERRAEAVSLYLIDNGVIADRIKTTGYGDTRPVADNDTPGNKAKNRRIEFRVTAEKGAQ